MSKWVSYGYSPQSDPEAIRARREEDELLRQHLPVILANSDRILETPRYFFCRLGTAFMSSLWIFGGGGPIPLGVLVLLWKAGEMIFECPGCGGRLLRGGNLWIHSQRLRLRLGPMPQLQPEAEHSSGPLGETILAVGPLLGTTGTSLSSRRESSPGSTGRRTLG